MKSGQQSHGEDTKVLQKDGQKGKNGGELGALGGKAKGKEKSDFQGYCYECGGLGLHGQILQPEGQRKRQRMGWKMSTGADKGGGKRDRQTRGTDVLQL